METSLDPLQNISEEALAMVPYRIARQFHVLPLQLKGDVLVIGMEDPQNFDVIDSVRFGINHMNVKAQMLPKDAIERGLQKHYPDLAESISQSISLAEVSL